VGSCHHISNLVSTDVTADPIRGVLEERRATTKQVAEWLGPLIARDWSGQASQSGAVAACQYHTPAVAA
jgi:hypothetical protein